jgi:S1-C subfamily serine protease
MDHARDIYMEEIVTKKAAPVKYRERTIGSSFQIKYKERTLTVTNHHVCSVLERDARKRARKQTEQALKKLKKILPEILYKLAEKSAYARLKQAEYPIVGEMMKIGDINRKVLFMSKSHDICFLEPTGGPAFKLCFLEPTGGPAFKLASSYHRGERISVIGHPRGMKQSITDGRIVGEETSALRWLKDAGRIRFLTTTAISYPGNSGSPAVNRYGNLVGILFAGWSIDYVNLNYLVPLEYIKADLESYLNE